MRSTWSLAIIVLSFTFHISHGALRRCFTCRSRGELGTCKDPFKLNATQAATERGVDTVPCASGWCSKIMEGGSDYGVATERECLSRGPSDSEERCAQTLYNHRKVYMCFCQGDLCNSSPVQHASFTSLIYVIFAIGICSLFS